MQPFSTMGPGSGVLHESTLIRMVYFYWCKFVEPDDCFEENVVNAAPTTSKFLAVLNEGGPKDAESRPEPQNAPDRRQS